MTNVNQSQATSLQKTFTFNQSNQPIRVELIENEPWFVAKDVCDSLGIENNRNATVRLDSYEKLTSVLWTSGQNREVTLVNESGLYSLIFQSRKKEAITFKQWVTTDVLPQIRKTGRYTPQGTIQEVGVSEPTDLSWLSCRFVEVEGKAVRMVSYDGVDYYHIGDVNRMVELKSKPYLIAKRLNRVKQYAAKLRVYGGRFSWFCTSSGVQLIIASQKMLSYRQASLFA